MPTSTSATDRITTLRRRLEGVLGIPMTEGNHVEVLRNGDQIFPAMLEAVEGATRSIDFLTYVYWKGDIAEQFARALTDRARAGVRVRVLLDAVGAAVMNRELLQEMRDAGATVEWFRPPTWKFWRTDHRTHRKVLVVDEDIAFTGGVGIADEWLGDAQDPDHWRDTHFRLRGPAVDGMRASFLDNWLEVEAALWDDTDQVPVQPQDGSAIVQVVRGDAEIGWSRTTALKRSLIRMAEERIRITTPYFSPDEVTYDLLIEARERGVEIEILVPGPHADKRVAQLAAERRYRDLLEAGVRLYRYQRTMLHAKVITIDGVLADVGSSNFNHRSFRLDEEVDVVILDTDLVAELDRDFEADLAHSERVDQARWDDRSRVQRLLEVAENLIDRQT